MIKGVIPQEDKIILNVVPYYFKINEANSDKTKITKSTIMAAL